MGLRAMQPPVPGLQEQVAEASKTRLQSAMKGIGTQAPVGRAQIAQAGAEAVQQQAQAVQRAQQTQLQLKEGQVREQQAQAQLDQREALNQRRAALNTSLRKAENTLTKLGLSTKQQLFDNSIQFEQDELGRTLFNERQLLDYAITHAKDVEAMQDYEQTISQLSERRLRLLQVAQQKIEMELRNSFAAEQSALNQEAKLALTQLAAEAKDKLAKEKAKAQNRASMWGALGGVAGAILGMPGGALGSQLGYAIGSGIATIASGQE